MLKRVQGLLFQFHKGPIKTAGRRLRKIFIGLFQFHKGPIKTLSAFTSTKSMTISIPQRSD